MCNELRLQRLNCFVGVPDDGGILKEDVWDFKVGIVFVNQIASVRNFNGRPVIK